MSIHRAARGRHRAVPLREDRSTGVRFADHRRASSAVHERTVPAHRDRPARTRGRRLAGMVTGFTTAAVLTAAAAWAIISAIATGSGTVGTATLSLTQSGNGSGLTTAITGMMPQDVVNRYVTVTNAGSANGQSLTLAITASTVNKLVTDAAKGLRVTVTACSVAWTASTGSCSGTPTTLLASTAVSSMGSAQTLVPGAFSSGTSQHLQVSLTLPDQQETTTDGTLPADTIQGLGNTLTYTFTMQQRAQTTTNS